MFQKQNVPTSIKLVAAVCLLFVVLNLSYFFLFLSTAPGVAPFALIEAVLFIAFAVGLLNLDERWRTFSQVITGLDVLVFPLFLLALTFSPDFFLRRATCTQISGIIGRTISDLISWMIQ